MYFTFIVNKQSPIATVANAFPVKLWILGTVAEFSTNPSNQIRWIWNLDPSIHLTHCWTLDISIIHRSISYASLALLKDLAGYSGHIHSPHGVEDLVTEILTSASEYQTRTRVSPYAIYHELHRTLNTPIAHENALAYWLGTTLRPSAFWAIIGTYRDSCFEWALSEDATEFISSMWPTLSTGLSRSKKLTYLKVAILYRAHRSVKFLAEMEPTVTIVEDDIESLMKYRSKTKATSAIRADELDLMVQTLRTCGVCKRKSHHSFKFVGQLLKAISR
jgi:hypothetical protein